MKPSLTVITVILGTFNISASADLLPATVQIFADTDSCASISVPKGVAFENTPSWQNLPDLPEFCQVRGQIDNNTRFELRLPKVWNGRFLMAGCGGFCGLLLPGKPGHSNSINEALKQGFAAISHDGGHEAPSSDTQWAFNNPELLSLYAHEVLPQVTNIGLELTQSLYKEPPKHKYFSGCSNGGRLGMIAAQRYPDLFDGIAAGASIFDLTGNSGLWGNWLLKHIKSPTDPLFSRSKNALLKQTVLQECDALDGQNDGIISSPMQCDINFNNHLCQESEAANICFTQPEATLLNTLYQGVKNEKSETVYPSMPYGSENYTDYWLFGTKEEPAWGVLASVGYRDLLTQDLLGKPVQQYSSTEQMLKWNEMSGLPSKLNATDTDLSALQESDAKLFIYHGWADPLILPQLIVEYYQNAVNRSGPEQALEDNARLFMVPGMGHCWENSANAPVEFDPLSVVVNWVETGKAPDWISVRQTNSSDELLRERPVCAYPSQAILLNKDMPNAVTSYACK
jgi:pimeloyl-ACP methyl ester carboxylesterase